MRRKQKWRSIQELFEAYKTWVPNSEINGKPREPKERWSFEFAAFTQGYYFGRMTDKVFNTVVSRNREAREKEGQQ